MVWPIIVLSFSRGYESVGGRVWCLASFLEQRRPVQHNRKSRGWRSPARGGRHCKDELAAVGAYVPKGHSALIGAEPFGLEQGLGYARLKHGAPAYLHRHHRSIRRYVEKLSPIAIPAWAKPSLGRYLPFASARRRASRRVWIERAHIDFVSARLVGAIRNP